MRETWHNRGLLPYSHPESLDMRWAAHTFCNKQTNQPRLVASAQPHIFAVHSGVTHKQSIFMAVLSHRDSREEACPSRKGAHRTEITRAQRSGEAARLGALPEAEKVTPGKILRGLWALLEFPSSVQFPSCLAVRGGFRMGQANGSKMRTWSLIQTRRSPRCCPRPDGGWKPPHRLCLGSV